MKGLSGVEVVKILIRFRFQVHSQKGSHIKLRRFTSNGKETLTIPNHQQLDMGTCYAIFKQASQYIPSLELYPYFYSEDT